MLRGACAHIMKKFTLTLDTLICKLIIIKLMVAVVIVWMLLAECSESISHNHTAHIKKCPDSIVGKWQSLGD